ncbi:MAG: hypothetical protein J6B75_04685 [Ruminococcus sp.]|nr:hypothetical protein [Ruminococcus sp.]
MKKIPRNKEICIIVWANIRKYQYLNGITDSQLSDILNISTRTLYTYDKEPYKLTLEKVQLFINETGIEMEKLITT